MPSLSNKFRFSHWLLRNLSIFPPFIGAGIRVKRLEPLAIRVEMKLRWFNRNAVGTHYGGSLYSMCDPFYMLILMEKLGHDYIVWDKSAKIQFLRPGRGKMTAEFSIPDEQVDEIREQADRGEKVEPVFKSRVLDEEGLVVATVEKLLYIRKKDSNSDQNRAVSRA